MPLENSLINIIALTLIPGIGDVNAKKLIAYTGGVDSIFKEREATLLKIPGIGPVLAKSITNNRLFKRAEEELEFIQKHKIQTLFYLDENYPRRLKNIEDSPILMYYKGNTDLNCSKIVGIVGTRKNTEYGKEMTEQIVNHYKGTDTLILSGMAYGIDVAAHKAALINQIPTVGVLAHGLDRIYPSSHRSVAEKMISNGGLLCDFMSGTIPDRENFPKRNRIVAGLSDALIVVEAAITGGALITAEIANSYNKDVFAVPGRVRDEFSEGCNRLIFANKASLITSGADVDYFMGWEESAVNKNTQTQLFINLNDEEQKIVSLLKEINESTIDVISIKAGMPMSKTASTLITLELNGVVKGLPGKRYKLN